jgi:hypothetical protein
MPMHAADRGWRRALGDEQGSQHIAPEACDEAVLQLMRRPDSARDAYPELRPDSRSNLEPGHEQRRRVRDQPGVPITSTLQPPTKTFGFTAVDFGRPAVQQAAQLVTASVRKITVPPSSVIGR